MPRNERIMGKRSKICFLAMFLFVFSTPLTAIAQDRKTRAIKKTHEIINEIVPISFPEIKLKKIRIKTFESEKSFFKARFSIARYLTFQRMRHLVYVNPRAFEKNIPESAAKAIIAHELAHVWYYTRKNRFELLGLASLTSSSFEQKFERKADLTAIEKGYGRGLIKFRKWLYLNISPDAVETKKRNYFSPEEIELMLDATKQDRGLFDKWRKKIPKNIDEIKKSIE